MASLRLGPLLRYTDGSSATVWVESSRPCTAEVRCADGARGESPTFQIAGHHYALVHVTDRPPAVTHRAEDAGRDQCRDGAAGAEAEPAHGLPAG